ncbi:phosphoenolpyruvate phosphomutase-domain-containing protein [Cenococcum geophilum]
MVGGSDLGRQNVFPKAFRALHIPGRPIASTNVHDAATAPAVLGLPSVKAIVTASYAVATAARFKDDDMALETNFAAIRIPKPLSADCQDGCGDRLEDDIKAIVDQGVVGINLEDRDKESQKIYPAEVAAERIRRALATAKAIGVPDFMINAHTDILVHGGELSEAIERGKAYLAAGTNTVFVWVALHVVELNVIMKLEEGNLILKDLQKIGVAGISLALDSPFLFRTSGFPP